MKSTDVIKNLLKSGHVHSYDGSGNSNEHRKIMKKRSCCHTFIVLIVYVASEGEIFKIYFKKRKKR